MHTDEPGLMATAASPLFWADRWRTGKTGWDLGGPHPGLAALVEEAQSHGSLPAGSRILEPGCGRAHGGAALARQGFRVTAFDVTREAIAAARTLYEGVPGLELVVQDALLPVPEWRAGFQGIYDRAMLCALPGALRQSYVRACFDHLEPGGLLLTIPFTEVKISAAEGPPFAVPMAALAELLLPGFSLIHAQEIVVPGDETKVAKETLCLWRRRPKALVEST